jgi:hypothetical protein
MLILAYFLGILALFAQNCPKIAQKNARQWRDCLLTGAASAETCQLSLSNV